MKREDKVMYKICKKICSMIVLFYILCFLIVKGGIVLPSQASDNYLNESLRPVYGVNAHDRKLLESGGNSLAELRPPKPFCTALQAEIGCLPQCRPNPKPRPTPYPYTLPLRHIKCCSKPTSVGGEWAIKPSNSESASVLT